jgi:glycerophosphoryl diester phosphodiesterase
MAAKSATLCGMTTSTPPRELPIARKVLLIAHRGASAVRPEHTLASYAKAIADGADFIEPDLVMTRDGVLVARHENAIGGTTDVSAHPEFAARRTSRQIDGQTIDDWFCEDFSLAELKTLRARERLPQLRGTHYDDQFDIPTLEEIIALAARESMACGRTIGIIPEIKHGSYFSGLGLAMEDRLLDLLAAHEYTRHAPIEIQSFEIANLRCLRERIGSAHPTIWLLQLLGDAVEQPWDKVVAGDALNYAQMMTSAGLRKIAGYADAIGPHSRAIIPLDADGRLGTPTALVHDAHAAGLEVHPYTFRPENQFLPRNLWLGDDPATINQAGSIAEIRAYLDAGIDAFFTDAPAIGREALDAR